MISILISNNSIPMSHPPTKRSILRATAKLFDPLGLLSPFVKDSFSGIVQGELGWDDKLEGSAFKCWSQLSIDLQ